jgi:hypothetical protein
MVEAATDTLSEGGGVLPAAPIRAKNEPAPRGET